MRNQTFTTERARTILHKCLSQFAHEQQIHAQQAVRYIKGFSDGMFSHKTVLMLSSALMAYILKQLRRTGSDEDKENTDKVEDFMLRVNVDKTGVVRNCNQLDNYMYRPDELVHMNFYNFIKSTKLERISA